MKKGDRVLTPDGFGIIIDDTSKLYIVQLEQGGIHFYAECELSDNGGRAVPVM
jgi:hypothetical protein